MWERINHVDTFSSQFLLQIPRSPPLCKYQVTRLFRWSFSMASIVFRQDESVCYARSKHSFHNSKLVCMLKVSRSEWAREEKPFGDHQASFGKWKWNNGKYFITASHKKILTNFRILTSLTNTLLPTPLKSQERLIGMKANV